MAKKAARGWLEHSRVMPRAGQHWRSSRMASQSSHMQDRPVLFVVFLYP